MLVKKIANPAGSVSGVLCTRSCSSLIFRFVINERLEQHAEFDVVGAVSKCNPKLRIDLQDNKTGAVSSVIPSLPLFDLGQVSTFGEGVCPGELYFLPISGDSSNRKNAIFVLNVPVRLALSGNLELNSDKFLDIQLSGLSAGLTSLDIFALESNSFSSVQCSYNKLNIPAGVAREVFYTKGVDFLFLGAGYTELQMTYPNGLVSRFTPEEVSFLDRFANDSFIEVSGSSNSAVKASIPLFSRSSFGGSVVPLNGAVNVEIIRDADASKSYEFFTLDYKEVSVSDILQSKLVPNSLGTTVNLDGSLSLKGGEVDSLLRNMSSATIYLKR